MAIASPEKLNLDSAKRNPSPIRHSTSSKRVKCSKDQIFEDPISESETKKSCHQCRQKSDFYVAPCKNQKKNKICSINFCRKCLFNRYGEKAEEVVLLSDWKCPKCRDICNCSSCRKKKGKLPTGMLVHTAKATGFTSVFEMLIRKENASLNSTSVLKDVNSSPKKQVASKETLVVLSEKSGKENSFAGKGGLKLQGKTCTKNAVDPPKMGRENEPAGKSDSNFVVNPFSSDFVVKKLGVCKHNNIGTVGNNGKASHEKEVSLLKNTVAKKSKVLKEQKSNCNKNGDNKVERKGCGIVVDVRVSKKACNAEDNSQISIKEVERKSETSKKTDLELVILKDTSQEFIKKDGKADDANKPCSVDEKENPDNENNDHNQAKRNITLNTIKRKNPEMEKSDAVILPRIETSKNSPTFNKAKQNSSNEEVKNMEPQMLNFEVVTPECKHKDSVIAEESSSFLAAENRMLNCGNDGGSMLASNIKPAVCDLKDPIKIRDATIDVIPLPHGRDLTNVAGIDLPAEDVGHALQFLEFCSAFGQFFHLMKGQPESILRDITRGCSRRSRTQYSPVVQFHIQLLSLLLKDSGEEPHSLSLTNSGNSWLQALGKCISESECKFDELPSNCFSKDGSGYNMLDSSKKLRLLNFLCDEALCTADLRTWIDEKNSKIIEKEKEAKQKVIIAKDKEKQAKQQFQDEIERASANGSSLSLLERDELVAKMKKETDIAHAEMLDALKKIPQMKKRADALRTDSILFDGNGCVFWRLKCYSGQPDILVQDIGSMDSIAAKDKWHTYEVEQKGMVERYISLRGKRVKLQRTPKLPTFDSE